MSNFGEDEPVTFKVVLTSDAAIKEVPLTTSTTKLMELKQILAKDDYFGSKAPVRRQRLFHLGRELKSGGRSLCNLGLGKFNNRILHLYIRPGVDGNEKGEKATGDGAGSRKRNRATSQQQPTQACSRQRQMESNGLRERNVMQEGSSITSQQPHSTTANSNNSNNNNNNNIAIDLVDSSDDDEVEIIEVL
mmetsp:Transcript_555/g.1227  ORF Transcript_555/g.1227 Transcript_555/m.1227 type:complete len:191 (-) Transcript_555:212-784(-)|eukprot:CAMPEP_0116093820 /NCGR_PEP_ID=MMETSP0327-20121206/8802_1 /TAXON_ID=44447 /ORGANISM="Pseudo-nitzschia delicatissima, Strain B596" /LENGTH=190 /DNA_ID=CAMNT_0003585383 /DNA_START=172 /DNA_END=744 /DNA_ORIENTATION=-